MATAARSLSTLPSAPARQRYDERPPASQRGYDRTWRKLRDRWLAAHPLCAHCERQGIVTVATEVDHVQPISGRHDPLRLDEGNLQSLCHRCHQRKGARERADKH